MHLQTIRLMHIAPRGSQLYDSGVRFAFREAIGYTLRRIRNAEMHGRCCAILPSYKQRAVVADVAADAAANVGSHTIGPQRCATSFLQLSWSSRLLACRLVPADG